MSAPSDAAPALNRVQRSVTDRARRARRVRRLSARLAGSASSYSCCLPSLQGYLRNAWPCNAHLLLLTAAAASSLVTNHCNISCVMCNACGHITASCAICCIGHVCVVAGRSCTRSVFTASNSCHCVKCWQLAASRYSRETWRSGGRSWCACCADACCAPTRIHRRCTCGYTCSAVNGVLRRCRRCAHACRQRRPRAAGGGLGGAGKHSAPAPVVIRCPCLPRWSHIVLGCIRQGCGVRSGSGTGAGVLRGQRRAGSLCGRCIGAGRGRGRRACACFLGARGCCCGALARCALLGCASLHSAVKLNWSSDPAMQVQRICCASHTRSSTPHSSAAGWPTLPPGNVCLVTHRRHTTAKLPCKQHAADMQDYLYICGACINKWKLAGLDS